jgi:large subunit ribosomal protein L21
MYAVIRSGGKQYKVAKGDRVRLSKLTIDAGETVQIDDVLAVHDGTELHVGRPTVGTAKVTVKIMDHARGPKIIVFRSRRRKGFAKKQGHRQDYTEVLIEDITV